MKVFGAFRVAVKMLLMWNSKIEINGGGNTIVTSSVLEVRNLIEMRVWFSEFHPCLCFMNWNMYLFLNWRAELVLCLLQHKSVISSNKNLGVYGQGLLKLTGHGDTIKAQRLSLSLFYNVTVSWCIHLLLY